MEPVIGAPSALGLMLMKQIISLLGFITLTFLLLTRAFFHLWHHVVRRSVAQLSSILFFYSINFDAVRQLLKLLKHNKAARLDPRTLKVCADQLCSVLHLLIVIIKNSSDMENFLPCTNSQKK